jgi:sec-independent protein translocase protein TatA
MFSGALQPLHLVLILVVVLILFGPGKLPDVGKAVGKTIREFKRSTQADVEEQDEVKAKDQVAKAQTQK